MTGFAKKRTANNMTNRQLQWAGLIALCFVSTACAGLTAAEVGTVAVTGAGALVGFIEALSPMLSPEQAAKLSLIAGDVQNVTQAVTAAVGQVAESVAALKAEQDAGWTTGEQGAAATGLGAAAVAASRVLSIIKHRPAVQPPA